jgi:hypothetical protein
MNVPSIKVQQYCSGKLLHIASLSLDSTPIQCREDGVLADTEAILVVDQRQQSHHFQFLWPYEHKLSWCSVKQHHSHFISFLTIVDYQKQEGGFVSPGLQRQLCDTEAFWFFRSPDISSNIPANNHA